MGKRNGKIELLRFVFSLIIMVYHFNNRFWEGGYLFNDHISLFCAGYIGVEFFFVLSGLLMGMSIDRKRTLEPCDGQNDSDLGEETLSFLWRKVKGILPYHLLYIFMMFCQRLISVPGKIGSVLLDHLLPDLFFLGRTGLMKETSNNEWYLTTLFFAILLLYPLGRKFGKNFNLLCTPVIAIITLGYIMHSGETLCRSREWIGWIYMANLRAIGELSLGLLSYEGYKKLKHRDYTTSQRVLLTILELGGYLIAFVFSCTVDLDKYGYYALLAMCISVPITFSQKAFLGDSRLFQNKLCVFLGKLSIPIFLLQGTIANAVQPLFHVRTRYLFLIDFVSVILISALVYLLWERVQRRWTVRKGKAHAA